MSVLSPIASHRVCDAICLAVIAMLYKFTGEHYEWMIVSLFILLLLDVLEKEYRFRKGQIPSEVAHSIYECLEGRKGVIVTDCNFKKIDEEGKE